MPSPILCTLLHTVSLLRCTSSRVAKDGTSAPVLLAPHHRYATVLLHETKFTAGMKRWYSLLLWPHPSLRADASKKWNGAENTCTFGACASPPFQVHLRCSSRLAPFVPDGTRCTVKDGTKEDERSVMELNMWGARRICTWGGPILHSAPGPIRDERCKARRTVPTSYVKAEKLQYTAGKWNGVVSKMHVV